MPRPLWSGAISFGLVNVPVRMFSAVRQHKLHFNYVHEPDGSPIGYQKICKAEDKPVPDEEIVKAFELEPGEWVYMTEEDFEAARAADEVQPAGEHAPGDVDVAERELSAAVELIERLAGSFEPEQYEDTYRERLCEIIRAKRKGERVPVAEVEEAPEEPEDLLAALRRSVEEAKRRRPAARRNGGNGRDGSAAETKEELLERARRLGVEGRSKMSKDELAAAVRRAEG